MSEDRSTAGPTGTAADQRPFWYAFSAVPGIGPARFSALVQRFGDARRAWEADPRGWEQVLDRRSVEALCAARHVVRPEKLTRLLAESGVAALTWEDEGYPPLLRQIALPPFVLYVVGDAALLARRAVAIVGTRSASQPGLRAARDIAGALAAQGLVVVSGLARGIDAAAHEAALASSGATVAVLGTGPDVAYPISNFVLQQRIARCGALVTEYPPQSTPEAGNFLARNRILSGLCLATVVVEAGEQSGALSTARHAADQGRDVLAVPGGIYSPQSVGSNRLLADGAGVCRGADDVLAALQLPLAGSKEISPWPDDPIATALRARLADGPLHIDELARGTGLPAGEVARALSRLELSGHVEHVGQMSWAAR